MIHRGVEYIAVQGKKCADCEAPTYNEICDVQCTMDIDTVWRENGYEAPAEPPFDTETQVKEYLLNPENREKIRGHAFCPISQNACSISCPGYKQPSYRQNFDKWVVILGRCDSPMLIRRLND